MQSVAVTSCSNSHDTRTPFLADLFPIRVHVGSRERQKIDGRVDKNVKRDEIQKYRTDYAASAR